MSAPPVHYARSGDAHIAYQAIGTGPPDLVWMPMNVRIDIRHPQLALYRGTEIDMAGDGVFATFDGPARAVRCACAIRDVMGDLGLELRAGVHTGECERLGEKVTGIAVHTGARVASLAAAGEVVVSSTVKDLVAGSGLRFDERGEHELKGVPGRWRVFAVAG